MFYYTMSFKNSGRQQTKPCFQQSEMRSLKIRKTSLHFAHFDKTQKRLK